MQIQKKKKKLRVRECDLRRVGGLGSSKVFAGVVGRRFAGVISGNLIHHKDVVFAVLSTILATIFCTRYDESCDLQLPACF